MIWSSKIYMDEVKVMLQRERIPFVEVQYPNEREYLKTYFRNPNLKGRNERAVFVLKIAGGNEKTPLWLEFQPGDGGMVFYDLYFGEYAFELFQNNDEMIRQTLTENIRNVLAGKIHVIVSWSGKNISWNGDACYYIAPGEADDDTEEYRKALRRIEKPRGWFGQRFGAETTYAIYNWYSYREITR